MRSSFLDCHRCRLSAHTSCAYPLHGHPFSYSSLALNILFSNNKYSEKIYTYACTREKIGGTIFTPFTPPVMQCFAAARSGQFLKLPEWLMARGREFKFSVRFEGDFRINKKIKIFFQGTSGRAPENLTANESDAAPPMYCIKCSLFSLETVQKYEAVYIISVFNFSILFLHTNVRVYRCLILFKINVLYIIMYVYTEERSAIYCVLQRRRNRYIIICFKVSLVFEVYGTSTVIYRRNDICFVIIACVDV